MVNFENFFLHKYLLDFPLAFFQQRDIFISRIILWTSLTEQLKATEKRFPLTKNACYIAYYTHLRHGCVFQGAFFEKGFSAYSPQTNVIFNHF